MNVAVSPMASEAASPMITSVTPTLEPSPREEEPSPAETSSSNGAAEMHAAQVSFPGRSRYQKPPPLHTGADWKVVLHLPEIETWLRATTDRVRDLTHYVHQDSQNKHVDVHLVQLKVGISPLRGLTPSGHLSEAKRVLSLEPSQMKPTDLAQTLALYMEEVLQRVKGDHLSSNWASERWPLGQCA